MSYIKQIIDYFFYHSVSDDLKNKVYHRMVYPLKDEDREESLKQLWDDLGKSVNSDESSWKQAFYRMQPVLGGYRTIKGQSFFFSIRWVQIAAVWIIPLVMLCTSSYFYFSEKSYNEGQKKDISYLQHYAALGTRERLKLPDSSEVWLNAGSTLIYPSCFSSEKREVHLVGEAFFDVYKDSVCPFIVNTHYLKMQVLGTTFNISAYPDETQVKATLETGSLKVNVLGDTTSYYLSPESQLIYTPSIKKVDWYKVRATDYSDWRMGGLFFDNTPFEDVLHVLKRTYGVTIHVQTSVYKKQKIYVHFNKNESLEAVFRILKLMIPKLEYRIAEKVIYIE